MTHPEKADGGVLGGCAPSADSTMKGVSAVDDNELGKPCPRPHKVVIILSGTEPFYIGFIDEGQEEKIMPILTSPPRIAQ